MRSHPPSLSLPICSLVDSALFPVPRVHCSFTQGFLSLLLDCFSFPLLFWDGTSLGQPSLPPTAGFEPLVSHLFPAPYSPGAHPMVTATLPVALLCRPMGQDTRHGAGARERREGREGQKLQGQGLQLAEEANRATGPLARVS